MRAAVVILNWNGKKLLEKFLPGVIANSQPDATVMVADNGSTDDSVYWLRSQFPELKIILNKKNYGFAGGYNEALKEVNADYFILLNSDVEVTPGWIVPMLDLMDKEKQTGACQPKILSYDKKEYFEYAGASGGYIDHLGYPFCRGRLFNNLEQDTGQYNDVCEVFWASGACMIVRAEVFKRINGFDPTFFAHMEEIDLCWRIQKCGYKIKVQPASVVYHVGGGTLSKSNPHKTYLNFRNNLLMLHKNLPARKLLPVILFRFILDGIAGLKFLLSSGPADCYAIIKAHFYFYAHLQQRIQLRKQTQTLGNQPVHGIFKGSLVACYYFKRIRTFSSIPLNKIN